MLFGLRVRISFYDLFVLVDSLLVLVLVVVVVVVVLVLIVMVMFEIVIEDSWLLGDS